ncbi:hypothetical protein [Paraburkholderia haematera]|uniref:Uncharacterized protein n=1 Tax=Paraburkholderia haematera TaxID=2793077 RepID=A0ABM8R9C3_9BURK|nr:hypothetical protein [Paraburkholderia haematera]CAE6740270.1 hypothetical protein R69888_02477 [Paraburkholderia haematera]
MSDLLFSYAQQFYNWLTTGNASTAPDNDNGAPQPPLPPGPPPQNLGRQRGGGGNLTDQIVNDPGALAIRQSVAARHQNPPPNGAPFPPPPPMNGLNVMNMNMTPATMSLEDELRSPRVRALRVRAHVRARQGEHGHVLARHHPSLTDQQLKDRLLTGLDPEGEPAPTSGVSSRFASEEVFYASLEAVHNAMATALANTRKLLGPNLTACADAEAAFNATVGGPPRQQAQQKRTEAYSDLRLALQSLQSLPDHLPVQWDTTRRCVILYPKYVVNLYQRKQVGVGFYGTGPKPNTSVQGKPPKGAGKQRSMEIYERVHPFNGPAENTLTVFVTPDSPMNAYGRKHAINNWGLITHYPQYHTEDNVHIKGDS